MKISIKVPATSANLGPGFDSLGLALDLWNKTTLSTDFATDSRKGTDKIFVSVIGEGANRPASGRNNLIVQAAVKLAELADEELPPFRLDCVNHIPMGAGLGSSSAAILSGMLGANALLGQPFSRDEILKAAAEMEGHPDNVAPALLGGLVVAALEEDRVIAHSIPVGMEVRITVVLPDFHMSTKEARAALPQRVRMKDAVHNISRAVLVAEAFREGDLNLLGEAMTDKLHQSYRLKLIPGAQAAMEAARKAGASAVALSGAGPALIAFSKTESGIGESMRRAFEAAGLQARILHLSVSSRGAEIQTT